MLVPLAACRESAGSYSKPCEVLYVFLTYNMFYSMLHVSALWYFDIPVSGYRVRLYCG